jgi:ligand-binding sensor domain-containing protein
MLWIGYWEGLFRIDPLQKDVPYVETGGLVEAVFKDVSGVLWYGGEDFGLIRKDEVTGTRREYIHAANNPLSISSNKICVIYEDRKGVLWVGGDSGLNRFDSKKGVFTHYKNNPEDTHSLTGDYVVSIYEDRQGSLWIGTSVGGLNLMNQQTGTFTRYLNDPKDPNSISSNDVSSICEDRSGDLWVGTYDAGLNHLNPETGKSRRFLHGALIYNLVQDSEGTLWVGTNNGLYRSNLTLEKFMLLNDANLGFKDKDVNGILEDDQKALWINTTAGICRLNQKRNEINVYSRSPERSIYRWSKCSKSHNGELLFGGNAGYYAFFPEQLTVNLKPPQIVINEFRVADQVMKTRQAQPIKYTACAGKRDPF